VPIDALFPGAIVPPGNAEDWGLPILASLHNVLKLTKVDNDDSETMKKFQRARTRLEELEWVWGI
jgi:hypothetical protein